MKTASDADGQQTWEAVQVIPCLDVLDGEVVKGVRFQDLQKTGSPAVLAQKYCEQGADEITVLDIGAAGANRGPDPEVIRAVLGACSLPLIVGGGIDSIERAQEVFDLGASAVSVGSASVNDPDLVDALLSHFPPESVVISLDVGRKWGSEPGWTIRTQGGQNDTGIDALEWARGLEERGVQRILLNSIEADGGQNGFDLELLERMRSTVALRIIASGGAGSAEHFLRAAESGADAVLAASVFHFGVVEVSDVKTLLAEPRAHEEVRE